MQKVNHNKQKQVIHSASLALKQSHSKLRLKRALLAVTRLNMVTIGNSFDGLHLEELLGVSRSLTIHTFSRCSS